MERVLITGANRGLGLEMVRQFLDRGAFVIASCRVPGEATALRDLVAGHPDRAHVIELAVDSPASVGRAAALVAKLVDGLDLLVNNAGVASWHGLDDADPEVMLKVYRTNTIAPLLVTRAFRPLLAKGTVPRVVNLSSGLGSMTRCSTTWAGSGSYAYNASKAALNMVSVKLAHDLRADGITVVAQNPGWVKTDMGGAQAPLEIPDAVGRLVAHWVTLGLADSGRFLDLGGQDHPW